MPKSRGGKPTPNSSTRMPAHFAVMKWPNSWINTISVKIGIATNQKNDIFSPFRLALCPFRLRRRRPLLKAPPRRRARAAADRAAVAPRPAPTPTLRARWRDQDRLLYDDARAPFQLSRQSHAASALHAGATPPPA